MLGLAVEAICHEKISRCQICGTRDDAGNPQGSSAKTRQKRKLRQGAKDYGHGEAPNWFCSMLHGAGGHFLRIESVGPARKPSEPSLHHPQTTSAAKSGLRTGRPASCCFDGRDASKKLRSLRLMMSCSLPQQTVVRLSQELNQRRLPQPPSEDCQKQQQLMTVRPRNLPFSTVQPATCSRTQWTSWCLLFMRVSSSRQVAADHDCDRREKQHRFAHKFGKSFAASGI